MSERRKLISVREEEVAERLPEGLREGGHVYPACSNCGALLMDIWRTRPHEPEVWKVRCNCPFCGDKSFTVEVRGGFHQGGMALSKDDEPDEDKAVSTTVDPPEIVGDTFVFKINKASEHAKPIYRR